MEETTIRDYALMVKATRDKQNAYFQAVKSGKPATAYGILVESKKLETELDKVTTEIITGQKQGTIF